MTTTSISMSRRRRAGVPGVMLAAGVLLAACGTNEASSSASSDRADVDAGYQDALDQLYAGTYQEPKSPITAEPATDKSIWVIPPGLNGEVYAEVADGVEEAADKLGWDVTVFDAKFSPTTMLSGVQQALAAGADGIVTYAVDCPTVENGLKQAKEAGVPTINIAGGECETPGFDYTVAYPGYASYDEYIKAFGEAQATYAIAMSDGEANVIMASQTDLEATRLQAEGMKDALAECDGCELAGEVKFVGADFGPALQSKISQALLRYPDADVFLAPYDAILTTGGAQSLRSSGRLAQTLVVGGEGSVDGAEMIRTNSGMNACLGYDAAMEAYGGVNYLVILFDGGDPSDVDNGVGFQACDEAHNLPAEGTNYEAPIDFRASYDRLWSLG
jgi:ribose transport system substrate-binding protein